MWIRVELSSGRIIKKEADEYSHNRWNNEFVAEINGEEIMRVNGEHLVSYEIFRTQDEMLNA